MTVTVTVVSNAIAIAMTGPGLVGSVSGSIAVEVNRGGLSVVLAGQQGPAGPPGAQGPAGPPGANANVPGTVGQVLTSDGGGGIAVDAGLAFDPAVDELTVGRFTVDQTYGIRAKTGSGSLTVGLTTAIADWSLASGFLVDRLTFSRANQDLHLRYGGNGVLEQRNGANAQAFHVYDYWTSGTTYNRGRISMVAGSLQIVTEGAGTGASTTKQINIIPGVGDLTLGASGSQRASVTPTGIHPNALTNTYDLGTTSLTWKNGYFGTGLSVNNPTALTVNAPALDITQTWNNAAATFAAARINITDTASIGGVAGAGNASDYFQINVGGSRRVSFSKVTGPLAGHAMMFEYSAAVAKLGNAMVYYAVGNVPIFGGFNGQFIYPNAGGPNWSSDATVYGTTDLSQFRGGPGVLEQRNGINLQKQVIASTWTGSSNWRGLAFYGDGRIALEGAGASDVPVSLDFTSKASIFLRATTGQDINLYTNGVGWEMAGGTTWRPSTDGAAFLGAANRRIKFGWFSDAVTVTPGTVAALPAPTAALEGQRRAVNDSSVAAAGNFGAVVAAGGANRVPVFCTGTAWIIA